MFYSYSIAGDDYTTAATFISASSRNSTPTTRLLFPLPERDRSSRDFEEQIHPLVVQAQSFEPLLLERTATYILIHNLRETYLFFAFPDLDEINYFDQKAFLPTTTKGHCRCFSSSQRSKREVVVVVVVAEAYTGTHHHTMSLPEDGEELSLTIQIVSCRDLLVADGKSSDPYVKVLLGEKELHQTKHVTKK